MKSVEYMPFLLSFSLFLNGGIWSIYAVIVRDIYVAVRFFFFGRYEEDKALNEKC